MKKHYDLVVVGSGAGLKVVDYAAKSGLKIALIDKGAFGGTCLNRGCVPSKMLIYPSDVLHLISESEKYNIKVNNGVPDFSTLVGRVCDTIDGIATRIRKHYEEAENVDVYTSHARFIDDETIQAGEVQLTGDRIYIGTGSRPTVPNIKGLADTPFLTSDGLLRNQKQPKKVVVLGGGFIAAELAHFLQSMGAEVSIIARSQFQKNIDHTIRDIYVEEFRKTHTIYEETQMKEVSYNDSYTISFDHKGDPVTLTDVDLLLVATGRQPNTDDLGLENTKIKTNKRGDIIVDEYLKADGKVTAYGDCIGYYLFRHMGNFEADYMVRQLLDGDTSPIVYPAIPYAVFSHPQLGIVGKTEQELKDEGVDCVAGTAEYAKSDMGKARLSTVGLVKLIFDRKTKKLLSAHIVGEEAATMIHVLIAFIHMGATMADVMEMVYIHPTLPEVIKSAAYSAKRAL